MIEPKPIPIPKPEIQKVEDVPIVMEACADCNTCRPDVYE